jgi:6-phosphogluconolactonase (cycloisomerase 2 family)
VVIQTAIPAASQAWMNVSYLGRLSRWAQLFLAVAAAFVGVSPALAQSSSPQFVYAAGEGSPNISAFQLNTTTGALTPVSGSPFNGRSNPHALAVDPAGKFLFVANQTANNISVFAINQTSGALTEAPNSPFASGSGSSPNVLTVDATGKFLFVANSVSTANSSAGELDVYQINSTTGALTPSPHSLLPATALQIASLPMGIYAHPSGKWLYLSDGTFTASLIQQYQIDPVTGDLTLVTSMQDAENPRSLAGDPLGHFLFGGHGQLAGFIDGFTISPTDGSLSAYASFNGVNAPGANVFPRHMTVDSTGTFLYTDLGYFMIPAVPGPLVPIVPITLISATNQNVPWTADLIGPFVFAADKPAGFLDSFQIDPVAGTITAAPGSPYAVTSGLRAIAVTGYPAQFAAPAATFSQNTFAFSGTLVGQSASFPITLTNTGFATLTVGTISITGTNSGDFSQTNNCTATLTSGANCTFTVTFTPQAVGTRAASLNIADNSVGNPHSVALSGEGLNPTPAVTLVPGSFTYPSAMLGGTGASQPFTVTNSGTGTLHFSSIALAGPNPGDFTQTNNCGATLAVNANCTINMTFKPQAVGTRTANITIVDDAANSPQAIALTGTGTAPFTIAPAANTVVLVHGQSTQLGMQFTSMPNFTGTVTFVCSGAPSGSTCAISPPSLPVTSQTTTTLNLIVNSTTSSTLVRPNINNPRPQNFYLLISLQAVPFALLIPAIVFARRRELFTGFNFVRLRFAHLAMFLALSGWLMTSACGGTIANNSVAPSGPVPGAYTLTVVATSGTASVTLNLTLSVQ